MGRDHTSKQHARSGHRSAPKSDNVYLKLLVKLYSFLARMYRLISRRRTPVARQCVTLGFTLRTNPCAVHSGTLLPTFAFLYLSRGCSHPIGDIEIVGVPTVNNRTICEGGFYW